jgi:hypothetical protein
MREARQWVRSASRRSPHENGGFGRPAMFLDLRMTHQNLGAVLNRERGVSFQIDLGVRTAHGARKRAEDFRMRERSSPIKERKNQRHPQHPSKSLRFPDTGLECCATEVDAPMTLSARTFCFGRRKSEGNRRRVAPTFTSHKGKVSHSAILSISRVPPIFAAARMRLGPSPVGPSVAASRMAT